MVINIFGRIALLYIRRNCVLQGGSESWFTESNVAIASLAFHPTAQLLLIATNNELHFWDWSRPEPFAVVKTGSDTERVRWVKHGRWSEVESERVHDVTVITERAAVTFLLTYRWSQVFSSTSSLCLSGWYASTLSVTTCSRRS